MLSISCLLILTVVKNVYKIFMCGANIQKDTCALAKAFYFWLVMNGCSWEIVNFFVTKNVSLQVVLTQNLRIHAKCSAIWSGFYISLCQTELEQLEHLRSEIPPATPWLPILVIHIRSQVKTRQNQITNFKKLLKIQILKFCKKHYTRHTFCNYLIRFINMKGIHPKL